MENSNDNNNNSNNNNNNNNKIIYFCGNDYNKHNRAILVADLIVTK